MMPKRYDVNEKSVISPLDIGRLDNGIAAARNVAMQATMFMVVSMPENQSYLLDLDKAISVGTPATRSQALWHATDLLIAGKYDQKQVHVFGEIIIRLSQEIEQTARAQLADRLAVVEKAPANVIDALAFDSSIDVARPVLAHSSVMSTESLVENAKTMSQQHLLAISTRKHIPTAVTDVLVVRGNGDVANTVVKNGGAQFSEAGFLNLLQRSENDSILAENLGKRVDIPRHVFQQLIAKATEEVKAKLSCERPDMDIQVQAAVSETAGQLHLKFGPASKDYFVAKRLVSAVHAQGRLVESKMLEYARGKKVDEAVVGLSLLCGLPVNVTERALLDSTGDLLLILMRALGYSWETSMAFLFLAAPGHRISAMDLEDKRLEFDRLSLKAAQKILDFYKSRKKLPATDAQARRLAQMATG